MSYHDYSVDYVSLCVLALFLVHRARHAQLGSHWSQLVRATSPRYDPPSPMTTLVR